MAARPSSIMSFDEWLDQNRYQVMFVANPGGSSSSSDHGLGPSDELCQLAFKQVVPAENQCIDPLSLELATRQSGQRDRSSFGDHVMGSENGLEASFSPFNHDPPFPGFSFPDIQDIGDPMDIDEDFFRDPEVEELVDLDVFFADLPEVPEPMEIDVDLPATAEDPEIMESDEQFFEHPEIRELVDIRDEVSDTLGTPEPMDIDVEEPGQVSDFTPLSPTPPSPAALLPPSSPLPPGPSSVESIEGLYLVERIIQSWGPKHRRQYLIRWEGWGPEFDTWEPACNLSQGLKADFERSRGRRR